VNWNVKHALRKVKLYAHFNRNNSLRHFASVQEICFKKLHQMKSSAVLFSFCCVFARNFAAMKNIAANTARAIIMVSC